MSPWTARGVLPCTSCLAPAQARQLPLARPQGSRKRVQGCRAAYGEHGAGGGRPSPSPPAHLHQELTVLREQRQRAAHRLQHLVAQEAYAAAAEERDALQQLELRERMLELAEAAEVKQEAGVVHCLGAVIQHRRYGYRGVIFGFDTRCKAPEGWCQAMKVDLLPQGRDQPFYEVLVDERDRPGGQTTYVAQENILRVRRPREVQHPMLPRFFSGFSEEEGLYVPGPFLREVYPSEF